MATRTDGKTDFEDLTPAQQQEALAWFAATKNFAGRHEEAARDQAFKVKPDGHISRRHSDRTMSTTAAKAIDDFLKEPPRRANDDIASGGVH